LRKKRGYHFFCLNDSSFPEISAAERAERLTNFLERYFPIPAPWEKITADENQPGFAAPVTLTPSSNV
jgi:hypothetical protein